LAPKLNKGCDSYIVASSPCRAYGKTRPRMIFHLYFRTLLFSALQSKHGSEDGSFLCSHVDRACPAFVCPFDPRTELILDINMAMVPWVGANCTRSLRTGVVQCSFWRHPKCRGGTSV
jgi:hypothetical protein